MKVSNTNAIYVTIKPVNKEPYRNIKRMFIREGCRKKTPEFETFVKKGGWGQDFVQTKILQEIVTRGGGENFACQNVFPIIYPLFNLFSVLFHGIY